MNLNKTAAIIVAAVFTFLLLLVFVGIGALFNTDIRNVPFLLMFVIAFIWFYKSASKKDETISLEGLKEFLRKNEGTDNN